jgi:hypothetical protein
MDLQNAHFEQFALLKLPIIITVPSFSSAQNMRLEIHNMHLQDAYYGCSAETDFSPIATKMCVLRRISRNPRRVCMSRSSAEGRNLVMPSSMDVSLTMRKTFLKVYACRGSAY